MATASQVVKMQSAGVLLNLNDEEAKALRAVLSRVGGDPYQSRREVITKISNAMNGAGYGYDDRNLDDVTGNGIQFTTPRR